MKVEILPAAERELEEAVRWYDSKGPVLGDRFLDEYQRAVRRIVAFPRAWAKISKRSRRCRMNKFPYGVIYQIRQDSAMIIAVAHLHRRPRYWRDREE